MAQYTQSNTDPVSVNGMFLKFYLDVMLGMTETFKEHDREGFSLYANFLRACVPSKEKRDMIDDEMLDIQKKIDDGVFGELGRTQTDFLRGFCVVSASVNFLNDAFHITMTDAASLADITDDELLTQLEKYQMVQKIKKLYCKDKERLTKLEAQILHGEIKSLNELDSVVAAPDEMEPQDTLDQIEEEETS